ncbi:hypothetical protein ACU686_37820 [Yinghuangia aomiensis]
MECGVCQGRKGYYRLVTERQDGKVVQRREWVDLLDVRGHRRGVGPFRGTIRG